MKANSLQSIQSSVRESYKDMSHSRGINDTRGACGAPCVQCEKDEKILSFLDSAVSQAWEAAILEGLSSVKGKHVVAKKSYPSESWDAGYHDALFAVEKSLINLLEAAKSPTGEGETRI